MLVFVYGTLCRGESNHNVLKNSKLISEQAWVKAKMYKSPSYYPFIKEDEHSLVYGEIYDIKKGLLPAVDRLEGYREENPNSLFLRNTVKAYTEAGEYEVATYLGGDGFETEHFIEGGDWKVEQALKRDHLNYFAYGSCMDNERFIRAGVDHLFEEVKGRSVLENYQMMFTHHLEDGARADIGEAHGEQVEGVLYKINAEALNYLYYREGVYSSSYRPTVVYPYHNGEYERAITFTVITKEEEIAAPLHYAVEIYRGARQYLSPGYINNIVTKFTKKLPVQGFRDYMDGEKRKKGKMNED
ncbi:gamma-glutamylcyclotransferase [Halobacillus campisalis]|uniref:Gamma-glutamylcyclotransferase n=1 Tax=Halobacillus campisalis TaxID=435909 RepID=A0ABW2K398_9BACI|nr:gamma-glutamylcyclotransferase family protein [Halobacillus campisalis]